MCEVSVGWERDGGVEGVRIGWGRGDLRGSERGTRTVGGGRRLACATRGSGRTPAGAAVPSACADEYRFWGREVHQPAERSDASRSRIAVRVRRQWCAR